MPSVRVRIVRKSHPSYTDGPSMQSLTYCTSGAATAPWVTSEMNTAALFDSIILSERLASASPTKKRSRRRVRSQASETRQNFDMMPAYAIRQSAEPILLRAVNTPLAAKAQEEMSDFEREYPW